MASAVLLSLMTVTTLVALVAGQNQHFFSVSNPRVDAHSCATPADSTAIEPNSVTTHTGGRY